MLIFKATPDYLCEVSDKMYTLDISTTFVPCAYNEFVLVPNVVLRYELHYGRYT